VQTVISDAPGDMKPISVPSAESTEKPNPAPAEKDPTQTFSVGLSAEKVMFSPACGEEAPVPTYGVTPWWLTIIPPAIPQGTGTGPTIATPPSEMPRFIYPES
jgi:hypothetical protein